MIWNISICLLLPQQGPKDVERQPLKAGAVCSRGHCSCGWAELTPVACRNCSPRHLLSSINIHNFETLQKAHSRYATFLVLVLGVEPSALCMQSKSGSTEIRSLVLGLSCSTAWSWTGTPSVLHTQGYSHVHVTVGLTQTLDIFNVSSQKKLVSSLSVSFFPTFWWGWGCGWGHAIHTNKILGNLRSHTLQGHSFDSKRDLKVGLIFPLPGFILTENVSFKLLLYWRQKSSTLSPPVSVQTHMHTHLQTHTHTDTHTHTAELRGTTTGSPGGNCYWKMPLRSQAPCAWQRSDSLSIKNAVWATPSSLSILNLTASIQLLTFTLSYVYLLTGLFSSPDLRSSDPGPLYIINASSIDTDIIFIKLRHYIF